ncbi:MAG: response regulator transcription factor [Phycisphaerae bacterium]|nr:response regulator transcription factor [Phycisphaerae bacterium]
MAKRIVIADDEMHILHILAIKLRNAGYEVFTAGDGEEALHVCQKEKPDLIITDYQMPYRNGLELCEAYRQRTGMIIPAMLITAREHDIRVEDVQKHGVDLVMAKPFSPREVVQAVATLLEDPEHISVG